QPTVVGHAPLHYNVAKSKVPLLAGRAHCHRLGVYYLRLYTLALRLFVQNLFFKTYFVINDRKLNHYCPQSSPTVSSGFSSTLSSTFEAISKSPPQSEIGRAHV